MQKNANETAKETKNMFLQSAKELKAVTTLAACAMFAALAMILDDSLTRLNALKQAVAFGVNIAAAGFFLFSGKVVWSLAFVMAIGALAGGVLGGKLASNVNPNTLRWLIVSIGIMVAVIYWIK